MKITLCQINFSVADFAGNYDILIKHARQHYQDNLKTPQLIVFPEGALSGYPLHDLVELTSLLKKQHSFIKKLQRTLPPKAHVLLGAIVPSTKRPGRPYFNAALYFHNKRMRVMPKTLLPTWDVFNEERWFEPGSFKNNILLIGGKKVLVTICEDIWGWEDKNLSNIYTKNPLKDFKSKIDLVVNLSASPFTRLKERQRFIVITKTALHFKAPVVYCNRWGAEDELIFDGHSLACQKNGKMAIRLKGYQEDSLTLELGEKNTLVCGNQKLSKTFSPKGYQIQDLAHSLALGIKDYCSKNGFHKVHLGLSGGIDSAVVACLAVEALGSDNVKVFALPTQFNAPKSLRLAQELATQLNVSLETIDIDPTYTLFKDLIDKAFHIPSFELTHENLQSRIRGLLLMAYSNHTRSLLLATSNKSELATGYGTLYGDMNGGLLPIGDLYKTQVFSLAKWFQTNRGWISDELILRPPSAELRHNQTDQDSLPKYSDLDKALIQIIEQGRVTTNPVSRGILSKIMTNEFKRWQGAPILKVSPRSFGRGRHWPLSHIPALK